MARRPTITYHPLLRLKSKSHQIRGKIKGKGMGSVLLDGGLGGQSSYDSIDAYEAATGRVPVGAGLRALPTLKKSKPSRSTNIRFNL